MRLLLATLALVAAVSTTSLEEILRQEHVDIQRVHHVAEELSKEVEESAERQDESELDKLREEYSSSHSGVTWEKTPIMKQNEPIEGLLFEGDLKLTAEQLAIASDVDPVSRRRRQALKNATWLWDKVNGLVTIAWEPENTYPSRNVPALEAAMRVWEQETCIRFRRATPSDKQKIVFKNAGGCWSEVGMVRGRSQSISIADGCTALGTVVHELSHALGTFHVQSREDRDNYVRIDESAISKGMGHNFAIEPLRHNYYGTLDYYGIPYEFGSLMHYGNDAFTTTGKPTIFAKYAQFQDSMGASMPTFYDIALINNMYKCSERCGNTSHLQCKNGGVVDVNKCNVCKCPKGFASWDCSTKVNGERIVLTDQSRSRDLVASMGNEANNQNGWGERLSSEESGFYLIEAPAGRRVMFKTNWENRNVRSVTAAISGCSFGGLEVKTNERDPRVAGYRVCNPRLNQTLWSDGNTMIIQKHRTNYFFTIPFTVSFA